MPKRDTTHMQAQRERILRATIRCISHLGLERTSVAEIRKEAGLSAGAIYTHFPTKDAIIVEALRSAAMGEADLPNDWVAFRTAMASADDQMDFDVATVARAKLSLISSAIRPGPMQDMLKPMLEGSLAIAVRHLETLQASGQVRLKMSAVQTAMSLAALIDGLIWLGLAGGREWNEIAATIEASMDCLIDLPGVT